MMSYEDLDPAEASGLAPDGEVPGRAASILDLLGVVMRQGASDLHLVTGAPPLIRLDGEIVPVEDYGPLRPEELHAMVYAVLTPKQRDRLERELSLDFAYSVPGRSRFRVNVYYQRATLGAAFRIIPYELKGIAELGMPDTVSELARIQRGLVLVTGPTGSGKSTTLAAMVDIVNSERRSHIMTVEDPIEFLHKHKRSVVSQREVGSDAHSFADALKHVLRQDPDVILVGEMRDLETISTAITAAETGHLVFATLHTQDSPQTIDRIIDVFPPYQQQQVRVQLSATLQGVVCQQLLPRAEGGGRVAASEILVVNPAVRNLIREGKTHQIYAIMQSGRQFGMRLMDASLAELVASRQISREVAIQHSHSPEDLNRLLQSISPAFASGSGFPPQAQSFNGGGAQ